MIETPSDSRILVVDVDDEARQIVGRIARSLGYAVESYDTLGAFLDEERPDVPGCVVLDQQTTNGNSLDLLRTLVADPEFDLPVIVVGRRLDVPTAVEFMRSGAATVLEKPLDTHHLSRLLSELVSEAIRRRERRDRWQEFERRLETLSAEERRTLDLLVAGETTKTAARRLEVSERTIERRRARFFEHLGVDSMVDLVRRMTAFEAARRGDGVDT